MTVSSVIYPHKFKTIVWCFVFVAPVNNNEEWSYFFFLGKRTIWRYYDFRMVLLFNLISCENIYLMLWIIFLKGVKNVKCKKTTSRLMTNWYIRKCVLISTFAQYTVFGDWLWVFYFTAQLLSTLESVAKICSFPGSVYSPSSTSEKKKKVSLRSWKFCSLQLIQKCLTYPRKF